MNAQNKNQILEWISYNKFKNIKYLDEGGFSIIYKAIWLDGSIEFWNHADKKWIRDNNKIVALKSLNNSSDLNNKFLNEV